MSLLTLLRRSVVLAVAFAVVCGLVYPLIEVGIAQGLFPSQANGSLSAEGSALIGQDWTGPSWFHGRPSPSGDDPEKSGPSNLGPLSRRLEQQVASRLAFWRREGVAPTPGLVEGSGSGLDPDISPAAALAQVPMVARARGVSPAMLRRLVHRLTHGREWGFLGEPYVNVLALNEALAGRG